MLPPSTASHADALTELLDDRPRLPLGHWPTPLEPMTRLSQALGGPLISVKRDDTSGLGMGGNKVRALEYIMAEARAMDADTIVTAGVPQSNSARQVAAAAAKLGLHCHIAMITDRVPRVDPDYGATGNILLGGLYGATYERISWTDDRDARLREIAARLTAQGRRPCIVPYGCSNATGAMGYLRAARETAEQFSHAQRPVTHVLHASGTGATQAGLVAGYAALGVPVQVIGIDIDADPDGVRDRVTLILLQLCRLLGLTPALAQTLHINSAYSANHYGMADRQTVDAIRMFAATEALIVDPVYSGKAAAALIDLVRQGHFQPQDHVVFLHSGGSPAIYAYRSLFSAPTVGPTNTEPAP